MQAKHDGRSLLIEGSVPSYMQIDSDRADRLLDSFANIFKSTWQSIKLLTNTLVLNINVLQGALSNDQKKIDAAFASFSMKREKYNQAMEENLKYFRDFYDQKGIDGLGGIGPKILAFAANPLLPFVAPKGPKKKKSEDDEDTTTPTQKAEKAKSTPSGSYTPRVAAALNFFFPRGLKEARLVEQAQPTQGQQMLPPEAQEEIKKIQSIARSFVQSEKQHADTLLDELGKKPAAIKKITEAKNFEELDAAIKFANSAGIKLFDKNIMSAKKKIVDDLNKKKKENPSGFAKDVEALRKQFPDLQGENDIEMAVNAAFGMSKSSLQAQLMQLYNSSVMSAMKAMNLPLRPEVEKQLSGSSIGQEYLSMVKDFTRQLETGVREVKAATKD